MMLRKLLGEGLGSCTMEELQQIEQKLEKSVSTIRAKKVKIIIKKNYIFGVIFLISVLYK